MRVTEGLVVLDGTRVAQNVRKSSPSVFEFQEVDFRVKIADTLRSFSG